MISLPHACGGDVYAGFSLSDGEREKPTGFILWDESEPEFC